MKTLFKITFCGCPTVEVGGVVIGARTSHLHLKGHKIMTCSKDCEHCVHCIKTVTKVVCKATNVTCNRDCYNCKNAVVCEYKFECRVGKS